MGLLNWIALSIEYSRGKVFWLFKILQIKPVNSKDLLILLSCFSDMADKKRKIANPFQNASYDNKFSKVVKSIGR